MDHAFFNDTGARYNQEAASQVYQQVLGWFGDTPDLIGRKRFHPKGRARVH